MHCEDEAGVLTNGVLHEPAVMHVSGNRLTTRNILQLRCINETCMVLKQVHVRAAFQLFGPIGRGRYHSIVRNNVHEGAMSTATNQVFAISVDGHVEPKSSSSVMS